MSENKLICCHSLTTMLRVIISVSLAVVLLISRWTAKKLLRCRSKGVYCTKVGK